MGACSGYAEGSRKGNAADEVEGGSGACSGSTNDAEGLTGCDVVDNRGAGRDLEKARPENANSLCIPPRFLRFDNFSAISTAVVSLADDVVSGLRGGGTAEGERGCG
jgi:hypothetical protein